MATGAAGERAALVAAMLGAAVTRPVELVDRFRGRCENRRQEAAGAPQRELVNREDAVAAAHELLGIDGCSSCADEVAAVAVALEAHLSGSDGHDLDAGGGLARSLWVLIRHGRPEHVVETGVFRGVSSAWMLDALERNGCGHLWSIDLPPERYRGRIEVGAAVPDDLRHRWTYIRGASRRRLPPLLRRLQTLDLFVHDGLHTYETMTFEFESVWPHISSGGVLVADDANLNGAFADFTATVGAVPLYVAEQGKESAVALLRRGVAG